MFCFSGSSLSTSTSIASNSKIRFLYSYLVRSSTATVQREVSKVSKYYGHSCGNKNSSRSSSRSAEGALRRLKCDVGSIGGSTHRRTPSGDVMALWRGAAQMLAESGCWEKALAITTGLSAPPPPLSPAHVKEGNSEQHSCIPTTTSTTGANPSVDAAPTPSARLPTSCNSNRTANNVNTLRDYAAQEAYISVLASSCPSVFPTHPFSETFVQSAFAAHDEWHRHRCTPRDDYGKIIMSSSNRRGSRHRGSGSNPEWQYADVMAAIRTHLVHSSRFCTHRHDGQQARVSSEAKNSSLKDSGVLRPAAHLTHQEYWLRVASLLQRCLRSFPLGALILLRHEAFMRRMLRGALGEDEGLEALGPALCEDDWESVMKPRRDDRDIQLSNMTEQRKRAAFDALISLSVEILQAGMKSTSRGNASTLHKNDKEDDSGGLHHDGVSRTRTNRVIAVNHAWRAFAVMWRILLERLPASREEESFNDNHASSLLRRGAPQSSCLELREKVRSTLFPVFLDALSDVPPDLTKPFGNGEMVLRDDGAAKLSQADEIAWRKTMEAIQSSVACLSSRWWTTPHQLDCTSNGVQPRRSEMREPAAHHHHHHEQQRLQAEEGVAGPPWGLHYFSRLLCQMERLNLRPSNDLILSLLLCFPAKPLSLSSSSPTRGVLTAASCMVSFIRDTPSQRWLSALRVLQQAHHEKAIRLTSLHLEQLLTSLGEVKRSGGWEAALRCAQTLVPLITSSPSRNGNKYKSKAGKTDNTRSQAGSAAPQRISPAAQRMLVLRLKEASWEAAFAVCDAFSQTNHVGRSGAAAAAETARWARLAPSVWRSLHLIATLHASWEVSLRWMSRVLEFRQHAAQDKVKNSMRSFAATSSSLPTRVTASVHFMHYVYCMYAVGAAGRWVDSLNHFIALPSSATAGMSRTLHQGEQNAEEEEEDEAHSSTPNGGGVLRAYCRTDEVPLAPQNVFTMSVAGIALLDHGHFSQAACFGRHIREYMTQQSELRAGIHGDAGIEGRQHETSPTMMISRVDEECALSHTSLQLFRVVLAIEFLGVLLSGCHRQLSAWVSMVFGAKHAFLLPHTHQGLSQIALVDVLHTSVVLHAMMGLGHLDAPFRIINENLHLLFDARYVNTHAVAASSRKARSTSSSRFIPPRHWHRQNVVMARALGAWWQWMNTQNTPEAAELETALGRVLTAAGVGEVFLEMTLV